MAAPNYVKSDAFGASGVRSTPVSELTEFEQLYAAAPVGLCLLDCELRFVRINQRMADINGYPVEEHIGRTLTDLLPEIADIVEPIYRRVIDTGQPALDFEVAGATHAAPIEQRIYLVSYFPVTQDGEVLGVSTVVQDVTERRRVEEALNESRQLLQAVIDCSPSVIYVKGIDGAYLLTNRECERLLGVGRSGAIGKTDFEVLDPVTAARCVELDRAIIESGQVQVLEETVTRDHRQRTYLSQRFPLTNSEDGMYGICGISTDITDRQEAERELASARERYEIAVQAGGVGLWDWDLRAGTIHLDRMLKSLLGYEDPEVGSKVENWLALIHPDDRSRIDGAVEDYLAGRTSQFECEHRMLHKNGTVRWFLARGSARRDERGEAMSLAGTSTDVTEARLLREELLEASAREQRRIGQELHDLTGQELTGLGFLARSLAASLERRAPDQVAQADRLADGLERALGHVRELSNGLIPVQVDADGLMSALDELADHITTLGGARCTFECPEPIRVANNQTASHLYRIAQEAVTNALKHGRAPRIRVALQRRSEGLCLRIHDNGVGFDEGTSVGNGLRIMRFRADLIGAALKIEQSPQGGTQVICTLALSDDDF